MNSLIFVNFFLIIIQLFLTESESAILTLILPSSQMTDPFTTITDSTITTSLISTPDTTPDTSNSTATTTGLETTTTIPAILTEVNIF